MRNPVGSVVLKLHSSLTSLFLICCFLFVTSKYYFSDPILCVSKFDRSVITGEMEQMCFTYSFTESQNHRYYVLHYKWIHWVFLALAFIYKLPQMVLENSLFPHYLANALDSLSHLPPNADLRSRALGRSIWYWKRNYGRHDRLYTHKMILHLTCLLVNLFAFLALDLLLQGHSYAYLLLHWPFKRDFHKFRDPLSFLFPPFTNCEMTPKMQLWMGRTERVGCHLPLMEVYEKLFLLLLVWQILLFLVTLLYISNLFLKSKVTRSKLAELCSGGQEKSLLVQKFWNVPMGEIYALSLFKSYLTKAQMRCLLHEIASNFFHIQ